MVIIMAYMSQDKKKELAPLIKSICNKYGIKYSLGVNNHSTLVLNIKSGPIDFIQNYNDTVKEKYSNRGDRFEPATDYIQVNNYWYHEHFTGTAKKFLNEVLKVMNIGNFDKSDIMTDFFSVGWYVDVNIGGWNKPYEIK